MVKCKLVFLFDSGEYFEESYTLNATPEQAAGFVTRIASTRQLLLASNVRIIQANAGKTNRVDLRGSGSFVWPDFAITLRRDLSQAYRSFRGVPKEIFHDRQATPQGLAAMANLNRVLRECACVVMRDGEAEPIGELMLFRFSQSAGKLERANKGKLIELAGAEEGEKLWQARKEKERQDTAKRST
jgi:hypothetical protein